MKLVTIVGTRPHFIKAAVVSRALSLARGNHHPQVLEILLHTGQHYDANMSQAFFECLNIPTPAYNLNAGSGNPGEVLAAMQAGVEKILLMEKPDWVLVYGDTNSTLAGALGAAKLQIPVAHVEAGLRSFNQRMPEERNRIATDHVSRLLFAPTDTAVINLKREGITRGVVQTGDVMLDAFVHFKAKAAASSVILDRLGLSAGDYYLATVHRQENTDDARRLTNIFLALEALAENDRPVIVPLHPRTRKMMLRIGILPKNTSNVRLIEAVSYLDMIQLEVHAELILTDSGGVQKEAYFAGVPCITLRDETEWIESVDAGANIVVGTEKNDILSAVKKTKFRHANPSFDLYGNAHAAEIIVDCLLSSKLGH